MSKHIAQATLIFDAFVSTAYAVATIFSPGALLQKLSLDQKEMTQAVVLWPSMVMTMRYTGVLLLTLSGMSIGCIAQEQVGFGLALNFSMWSALALTAMHRACCENRKSIAWSQKSAKAAKKNAAVMIVAALAALTGILCYSTA
jgi:hypothetical protein